METEIKLTELIGTDLRTRDFKTGAVFFEPYKPKLEYAWDTGKAIGRFLAEIKKDGWRGRIALSAKERLFRRAYFAKSVSAILTSG